MTTEQINEQFDIVFSGKKLLCVYGADHPVIQVAPPIARTVIDTAPRYAKVRRGMVIAAMPGTVDQIAAKSGVNLASIRTVLAALRKEERLVMAPVSYFPLTYSYSLRDQG